MVRKLSESVKKIIAGRQFYKCANKPDSNLPGIGTYRCPLWRLSEIEIRGCFDESGYEIDHVEEYVLSQNDSTENLQALCKMCHAVKTKNFNSKYKKTKKKKIEAVSSDSVPEVSPSITADKVTVDKATVDKTTLDLISFTDDQK